MDTADLLRSLEEKLLDNSTRKSAGVVSSMLTDDFQEFGSSGRVYSKQQIIDEMQKESPLRRSLTNFHAELLSDRVALVTYLGQATASLRSSIWVLRNGDWKLRFHQGTKTADAEGNK